MTLNKSKYHNQLECCNSLSTPVLSRSWSYGWEDTAQNNILQTQLHVCIEIRTINQMFEIQCPNPNHNLLEYILVSNMIHWYGTQTVSLWQSLYLANKHRTNIGDIKQTQNSPISWFNNKNSIWLDQIEIILIIIM